MSTPLELEAVVDHLFTCEPQVIPHTSDWREWHNVAILGLLDKFDESRKCTEALLARILPYMERYIYRSLTFRHVTTSERYRLAQALAERTQRKDLLERLLAVETKLGHITQVGCYGQRIGRQLRPGEVWDTAESYAEDMSEGTMRDPETSDIADSQTVNRKILHRFVASHLGIRPEDTARIDRLVTRHYDLLATCDF